MKFFKRVVLFSILVSSLSAKSNYCIQVAEIYGFDENHIDPTVERILNNFDKARIDRRGRHLILRVGDYTGYSKALKDLAKLKSSKFPDAFIRRCDYIESKIVYPKRNKKKLRKYNDSYIEEIPLTKEVEKKGLLQKEESYKLPKEPVSLENSNKRYSYDFWQECKKCYAPLEDEQNYKKVLKKSDVKKDIIEKDDFFKKHSKVNNIKPTLKESDSFFGDAFDFDENNNKSQDNQQQEEIKLLETPKTDNQNNYKQPDDDIDDFFDILDDNIKDDKSTQSQDSKEIQNTPKEKKPKEVEETLKEDTTDNKEETDDLYDMFGIDDL